MTAEAQPGVLGEADEAGALRCYRPPERETYMRCGRCDRPICTKCGLQGPVGFRCRDCGQLAHDRLTSFTPLQVLTVLGLGAGIAAASTLVGGQLGYFGLLLGFFAGTLTAELSNRMIGYKRGPVMIGLMSVGIVLGVVVGSVLDAFLLLGLMMDAEVGMPMAEYLVFSLRWSLILAGAMIFGVWTRVR